MRSRKTFRPAGFLQFSTAHTRLIFAGLLGAAALVSASCSGGGGSSGPVTPATVSSFLVVPGATTTELTVTLTSAEGRTVDLIVAYSEDRGLTYQNATSLTGETTNLAASESGTAHVITWNQTADLSNVNQADLRMRVTPTDSASGDMGTPVTSNVFAIGTNSAPTINSITTPSSPAGGTVTIDYTLSDPESDTVEIAIAFSTNGGSTWENGTADSGGDGAVAVTTDTSPVNRSIVWDAHGDIPDLTSATVRVRLTPSDTASGTAMTTADFTINTMSPSVTLLTVGEIPETMNGSTSYTDGGGDTVNFSLTIPTQGSQLRAEYESGSGGFPIDINTLSITADQDFGSLTAGANLGGEFDPNSSQALWTVPGGNALTSGVNVTLSARISDNLGNQSTATTLTVKAVQASGGLEPFDFVDTWHINFDSDLFETTFSGTSTIAVVSTAGANGTADYTEDLRILGLQSSSPTAPSDSLGTNAILLDWVKTETMGRLFELFGKNFDGTGDGFNANLRFQTTSAGATSAIRIGGDDAQTGFTLGRAQFDYRNGGGNSNTSTTLGVFITNMIEFYINSSFTFQNVFNPLVPGRGTPAGEDALDHIVLAPSFDRLSGSNSAAENDRYDEIATAVDAMARIGAVVLAHEIGHSIGLVAQGLPPDGLFGGVTDAPFSGFYTTDFHFDSSGNNVMAAALSFSTALISTSDKYHFNELNEAYLREWILLTE